jgi:hypothetical protein
MTQWWVVETELGATACPSRTLAHQAAEVCHGAPNRLRVGRIRIARPNLATDAIAIKQAQEEINQVSMDQLNRSGALTAPQGTFRARRDTGGRVISIARRAA